MTENATNAGIPLGPLLQACLDREASDLHLVIGSPPTLRIQGALVPLGDEPAVTDAGMQGLAAPLLALTPRDWTKGSIDGAMTGPSGARFRFNVFRRQGGLSIALRRLEDRFRPLEELGLPPSLYSFCDLREGLVAVCGPTGAGKSTTLATLVDRINRTRACHIVTIEDPIEYVHRSAKGLVNQRQVGLDAPSFNDALVASLRQDPDVILVGEVRDNETAEIAVQAALTGHLILSTLHTNDAASAITRLLDMGVEDYLLTSTINGVMAQRLVRKLCPDCRELCAPLPELGAKLGLSADMARQPFHRAKGCEVCNHTGYRGRTSIMEVLPMSDPIRHAVLKSADAASLDGLAQERGMQTMRMNGLKKALAGITSLEEVMRVTRSV